MKDEKNLILICALFIHAAKMDENYTDKEKSIILRGLMEKRLGINLPMTLVH